MKKICVITWFMIVLLSGCAYTNKQSTEQEKPENSQGSVDATITPASEMTAVPTMVLTVTKLPTPSPTLSPTPSPTVTPTPTPTATPTPVPDTEAPELSLLGDNYMEVIARREYIEPGFTAMDLVDGDLTERVQISGLVDVNCCGTYNLTYEVTDAAGNYAVTEREIIVKQPKVVIPEGKVIYLTFDDGPGKYTEELLELLARYEIKVTFFTCGNGMLDLLKKIQEAGHTVAIHCKSHDYNVVYASDEAYFEDLFAMQDFVYEATGIRTTLVRFPGGSSNQASSFNPGIMTRLTTKLEQMGFQYFDWNVSSGDSGTRDTKKILENLKKGVQKQDCSIVLQHPETREFSLAAVESFIVWALENGYRFLPLDETSPRIHHKVSN